jgi:hypothetical protein
MFFFNLILFDISIGLVVVAVFLHEITFKKMSIRPFMYDNKATIDIEVPGRGEQAYRTKKKPLCRGWINVLIFDFGKIDGNAHIEMSFSWFTRTHKTIHIFIYRMLTPSIQSFSCYIRLDIFI